MAEILFLAHRIPYPPNRGDKIRSWHILREIAGFARVHLACFADDEEDAAHGPALRSALGGQLGEAHVEVRSVSRAAAALQAVRTGKPLSLTAFESAGLEAFVQSKLASVDAVYAFSGQMAQFIPTGARPRFVMDFVDVDSAKFADYAQDARAPMRLVYAREAKRLLAFETEVAARADASLFVSESEAALFRRRTGLPGIASLANGIDSDFFDPSANFPTLSAEERGEGPILLFTGQMDYRPNVDAVRWFAAEVLPLLPDCRFVIAGRNPTPEVRALAGFRVTVTGAVGDMRSWLAAADVVVAPLRIARGVQNKVLEAMAMERPVVASPAAFEGIEAQAGRHLLVADEAKATAEAINGLLANPATAREMGQAARSLVAGTYRWEARLAPLRDLLLPGIPAEAPAPAFATAGER
jgi:sugar transferase (PEP-CTERM/EpsH1 system associated)